MASVLPFNQILVGSSTLAAPDAFVYGTGSITMRGEDNAVTTADGKIHNYRAACSYEARCELRGDLRTSADTGDAASGGVDTGVAWPTLGGTIKLQLVPSRGGTPADIISFGAVVSAEYDAERNTTSVTMTGFEE